jgi:hypothetical protein
MKTPNKLKNKKDRPMVGNGLVESEKVFSPSHFPTLALPRSGI